MFFRRDCFNLVGNQERLIPLTPELKVWKGRYMLSVEKMMAI